MLRPRSGDGTLPIRAVFSDGLETLSQRERDWAKTMRFAADAGAVLVVPGEGARPSSALLGLGARKSDAIIKAAKPLLFGALAGKLPAGQWHVEAGDEAGDPTLRALAMLLGAYRFTRYKPAAADAEPTEIFPGEGADLSEARHLADAVFLARDLINTPTNDLGPAELEAAARNLASEFGAEISVTTGDDLLAANFPMIHAVGRASASAPRLIDFSWGAGDAPKVTLVGKGVCFDTGGLDIKPSSSMLLMKKDMGGSANVLALARLIMAFGLAVRLRVLVPAVENSISASAFRPSDVLKSRKGKTVEIGNTDAEGRLVLADALALADDDEPEILIDMATLTGAARVALGPDVPPFFTADESFAAALAESAVSVADPIWRLPLWQPYADNLASKVADVNNVTSDGFAGSITAALFLEGFVEKAKTWAHFDVYGWRPKAASIGGVGGEAQAIRAIFAVLKQRFPAAQ
ncbi:leucyl aminopeptidase family protein [Jiella sp. MQZ9-1]|uniref:Leucyl aminopeptidase family protein n=2 Tax=Jiella flava TaxID=2816857 RepID=A0A939FXM5_9HYPH|nr:leucyl aminopeptidase family protein [Jiella flava]MBO0663372.1 leucyl aminopeptidase family protein [Jiella flava]MCD2471948.1 leucyl aminopeptidase family protein [Jiella flava]